MSTLDEAISKRHRLSIWHFYHKGDEHISIIPFLNPRKELGSNKKRHDKLAARYPKSRDRTDESNSYFVHHPTLLFHNTPRTLRRGNRKNGAPICLIKCGAVWRNWTIQFGGNLKDVIDPRGVVKWECRSNPNNTTLNDDHALKGCKVHTWRGWGESGETYHRQVNARRKAEKEEVGKGKKRRIPWIMIPLGWRISLKLGNKTRVIHKHNSPVLLLILHCDRRLYHSQLLRKKRSVSTGVLHSRWILDAIASNMPISSSSVNERETSTRMTNWLDGYALKSLEVYYQTVWDWEWRYLRWEIYTKLRVPEIWWVFDSAVSELLGEDHFSTCTEEAAASELRDIRQTRLYELIMATAMCMIIGESQKWIITMLLFTIAAEGGNPC